MTRELVLEVDGDRRTVTDAANATLLEALREGLGNLAVKNGCAEGECGACTVLLGGQPVCACLTLAAAAEGRAVTTVAGLRDTPAGRAVVEALVEAGAVQCGFCTPGIVVSLAAHLGAGGGAAGEELDDALAGNLCRCTGYAKVRLAAQAAASAMPAPAIRPAASARPAGGPRDVASALEMLAEAGPGAVPIAGGTDLLVDAPARLPDVARLVPVGGVEELRGIRLEQGGTVLSMGAAVSWSDLREDALARAHAPLLAQAAALVGGRQIQNAGTIGGNIATASPAGDGLPPLFAMEAWVEIAAPHGAPRRVVVLRDLVLGPRRTALSPGELLVRVEVPVRPGAGRPVAAFRKLGPRRAQAIAKASVAFQAELDGDRLRNVRIALGAVAPGIVRATAAEAVLSSAALTGRLAAEAARAAAAAAAPITDIRSTAGYRRHAVAALVLDALWQAGVLSPEAAAMAARHL